MSVDARFIEAKLPLSTLNKLSSLEVSYIRVPGIRIPGIRNIHIWFARRPTGPARVLTLASVLPSTLDESEFSKISTIAEAAGPGKTIYMVSPDRKVLRERIAKIVGKSPSDIIVLDPMAGGGSIPLESARLGFRTIAIEYNPVAYLILKATLEFPSKYAGAGLFEETLRASKELIRRAGDELGRYYSDDSWRYVFARGVECPFCQGLIPIQGVEPEITKDKSFKRRFLKLTYDKAKKTFSAQTTNEEIRSKTIAKRRDYIQCPYCGKWFQLRGRAKNGKTSLDKWFEEHAKLMKSIVEEFTPITSEIEEKLLRLHIPLIKHVKKDNTFHAIWDDETERKKFIDALHALSSEILDLQDYIQLDEIPRENMWARTARSKGITRWYMLFNPRQLLTIAKLSKFVAEIAEDLASKNGEFGAAVALYLALAVDKIADYNTIATKWQSTQLKTGIGNTFRGESTIDFRSEYCEIGNIEKTLMWALEPDIAESGSLTKTAGGVLPVLRFLSEEFRDGSVKGLVSVYMADATRLSSIFGLKSVDVINVDPPYFEQVIYSDRSEFFWAILRRSLAPVLELLFRQNLKLEGWTWTSPKVPREREVVAQNKEDREGRFRRLFKEFIAETSKVLKDDGVLLLWFTHPTALAWQTVGEALYEGGYVDSKVWPLLTEMPTRYKKHVNVIAQEMSLVIVGRKYPRRKLLGISPENVRGSLIDNTLFKRTVEEEVDGVRKVIEEAEVSAADAAALMFGTALSVASRFELPIGAKFEDLYDATITAVISEFTQPLIRKVLTETGPVKLDEKLASTIVENVTKAMLWDPAARSYLTLWLLSRVDLSTAKVRDEHLGLSFDLVQTVGKLCGFDIENLKKYSLISEKEKAYYPQLLEMLTLAGGKTPIDTLRQTSPGRAVELAYKSMSKSGDPAVRAKSIRDEVVYDERELSRCAALAIVLLETARDQDLGFKTQDGLLKYAPGLDEREKARIERELAIKTLAHLIL